MLGQYWLLCGGTMTSGRWTWWCGSVVVKEAGYRNQLWTWLVRSSCANFCNRVVSYGIKGWNWQTRWQLIPRRAVKINFGRSSAPDPAWESYDALPYSRLGKGADARCARISRSEKFLDEALPQDPTSINLLHHESRLIVIGWDQRTK